MLIAFAFCIILNVFLIAFIANVIRQPKKESYVKDDSEIRGYLAKNHYKNGIYVKFSKHIRSINPLYNVEIQKDEVVWLERFVLKYETGIDMEVVGSCGKYSECYAFSALQVYDPRLTKIERNGELIIIKLPRDYMDDELWTTPTKDELIVSLF